MNTQVLTTIALLAPAYGNFLKVYRPTMSQEVIGDTIRSLV